MRGQGHQKRLMRFGCVLSVAKSFITLMISLFTGTANTMARNNTIMIKEYNSKIEKATIDGMMAWAKLRRAHATIADCDGMSWEFFLEIVAGNVDLHLLEKLNEI